MQIYIYFNLESPVNSAHTHQEKYNNFFNWTMTYRKDSDIAKPYGWIVPIDQPALGPFQTTFNQSTKLEKDLGKKLRNNIKRKTKLVAWIVSHCHTDSEREK